MMRARGGALRRRRSPHALLGPVQPPQRPAPRPGARRGHVPRPRGAVPRVGRARFPPDRRPRGRRRLAAGRRHRRLVPQLPDVADRQAGGPRGHLPDPPPRTRRAWPTRAARKIDLAVADPGTSWSACSTTRGSRSATGPPPGWSTRAMRRCPRSGACSRHGRVAGPDRRPSGSWRGSPATAARAAIREALRDRDARRPPGGGHRRGLAPRRPRLRSPRGAGPVRHPAGAPRGGHGAGPPRSHRGRAGAAGGAPRRPRPVPRTCPDLSP